MLPPLNATQNQFNYQATCTVGKIHWCEVYIAHPWGQTILLTLTGLATAGHIMDRVR
jgi:hypothetical protein